MEKERLDKVRRIVFLENELLYLESVRPQKLEVYRDFNFLRAEDNFELTGLYFELYPEPPKDLMEDVKKRMEAYKRVKVGSDSFITLSFRQKIKNLFRRKICHEETK
jgi:hypothetical protein